MLIRLSVDAWHANINAHYMHPHKYMYTRCVAEYMHASIIHTSSAHLCTSALFAKYVYKIWCRIPACKHNSYVFCTFVYLRIVEAAWQCWGCCGRRSWRITQTSQSYLVHERDILVSCDISLTTWAAGCEIDFLRRTNTSLLVVRSTH
jgi:hypothetical protein